MARLYQPAHLSSSLAYFLMANSLPLYSQLSFQKPPQSSEHKLKHWSTETRENKFALFTDEEAESGDNFIDLHWTLEPVSSRDTVELNHFDSETNPLSINLQKLWKFLVPGPEYCRKCVLEPESWETIQKSPFGLFLCFQVASPATISFWQYPTY